MNVVKTEFTQSEDEYTKHNVNSSDTETYQEQSLEFVCTTKVNNKHTQRLFHCCHALI